MRLLEAETHKLRDFAPDQIPQYAILSHTWGNDEVTFDDLEPRVLSLQYLRKAYRRKAGWKKIQYTCQQALKSNLKYVWVDTCCIDKSSSAELSEAINSMYIWYQRATSCYVYLSDVRDASELENSRYWTRGWCLQELIAPPPSDLWFFTSTWSMIGSRISLKDRLISITGIHESVIEGTLPVSSVSVAQRMSWAANRQTTRPEDRAYSLMGIFGVNMPTLYGEGEKAFQRLQEEICKINDDHSLFAWTVPDAVPSTPHGLFAKDLSYFRDSGEVIQFRDWTNTDLHSVNSLGITINLPVRLLPSGLYEAVLNCRWSDTKPERVGILLRHIQGAGNQFQRVRVGEVISVGGHQTRRMTRLCVRADPRLPNGLDVVRPTLCTIQIRHSPHIAATGGLPGQVKAYIYRDPSNDGAISVRRLPADHHFNDRFVIPGLHRQLSVAINVELTPSGKALLLLVGSAGCSFYPTMTIIEDAEQYTSSITQILADEEDNQDSGQVASHADDEREPLFEQLCMLYEPVEIPGTLERHMLKDGMTVVTALRTGVEILTDTFQSRLKIDISTTQQIASSESIDRDRILALRLASTQPYADLAGRLTRNGV